MSGDTAYDVIVKVKVNVKGECINMDGEVCRKRDTMRVDGVFVT
jgi:hypothetical protein